MSGSAEHSLLKNFFEKYILKAHKVFFFFLNTVSQVKWSHSIFNVAYKYNLLLVLKILSYSLYNNLTDEMQAVASECKKQTGYILTIHNINHEAEEQLGNAKASPLRM